MAKLEGFDDAWSAVLIGTVTLGGVIFALAILPGLTIGGLLTMNPRAAALLVGLFFFLVYFGDQAGTLSFPFVLSAIVVLLFVNHYLLPSWVSGVFTWEKWLGVELGVYSPAKSAVLVLAIITVYWVVTVRLGGPKKARPVAEKVLKKYTSLVETYVSLGRVLIVMLIAFAYVTLGQAGQLFGQFGDILAQAPFIASNMVAGIVGFDALGGDLPIIESLPILSDLSPIGWLFFVALLLILAASAKYESSGALSRVFN